MSKIFFYIKIYFVDPRQVLERVPLPSSLLEHCDQKIWLLQPRQVAAKMVAKRIAELKSSTLGQKVGYHVRFDNRTSDQTQLTVMTQGMFVRHLDRDPYIEDVEIVILDEFP